MSPGLSVLWQVYDEYMCSVGQLAGLCVSRGRQLCYLLPWVLPVCSLCACYCHHLPAPATCCHAWCLCVACAIICQLLLLTAMGGACV